MRTPYSASIEMAATPPQVFAVLIDPALFKRWTRQVVEVTPPEGGLRVGATSRAVVQEFGRRFSAELVVLALEPNTRIAYRLTSPTWSGRIEYVIAERHPSADVSILFAPDPPKSLPYFVAKTVGVLARPLMTWRLRSMLAVIRKVVEANGQTNV